MIIYDDDITKIYTCGCRLTKLEYPYKDIHCEKHKLLRELKRMVEYYKPGEIRKGTRFEALEKISAAERIIAEVEDI